MIIRRITILYQCGTEFRIGTYRGTQFRLGSLRFGNQNLPY